MILSAPFRELTKLVATTKPSIGSRLFIHATALSSPMLVDHTERNKTAIEQLCSGVFPDILTVTVIDAATVLLTFENDVAAMEFALQHGEEITMTEVRV